MSLNLGSVGTAYVDIQADLSSIQAALSGAVADSSVAASKVSNTFNAGLRNIGADNSLESLGSFFTGIEDRAGKSTNEIGKDFGSLFTGIQQVSGVAAQQLGFDFEQAEGIIVTSSQSMGTAVEGVGGYFQNLKQSVSNFGDALTPALERLDSFRPMLSSLGTQAQGLGTMLTIGVTAPVVALGAASVHAFADIDSLKRGLTAVAGSAEEAKVQFADMREVAKLPGLGLEEAVQGSIRLQSFGFSATQSKEALLAFGNAIATVGGGKGELDGVIKQLGQMAGASKVLTQDLRPIIQQVPQVAGILKAAFGADVLSDPAKRLEQLGVSTQQFIQIMISGLSKLPPVTGGIKNDLENFSDSATIELSRIGEALAPMVHDFVELAVPAVHAMVDAFVALPGPARDVVIGIAGIAAVAGPALIIFGSMSKGLADIIGIAKTFNEMRVASNAITEVETASTAANTAMRTAAEAEVLLGDGGKAAAVGLGIMSDAELLAAKEAIGLDAALGKTALLGTLAAFGEALVVIGGAAAGGAALAWLVSLLDPLRSVHREMDGAAVATHQLTVGSGLMGDSFDRLVTSVQKMGDGHRALSVSAQELINKQKGLQQEYDLAKRTYDELLQAQKDGVNVGNALALAHDKMTKAFKELNPQIAENEKATKAATAARLKDSEEAKKQDAEAVKRFDEAKKREAELVALQKSGVDVTKALKEAKDELSAAFLNLNKTVQENAREQLEANAGTKEAADVAAVQRDALFKVSEAARDYIKSSQDAAAATLNHEIATNRVVGVLKDGVTYIHSFSDAQVEAAKTGSLTWKQIQDSVGGVVSSIKMVRAVVDVAAVSFEELTHGAVASMGDLSGSVIDYEGQLSQATVRVTDHLQAVRLLRGEGVQHIETLADEIDKLGMAWISASEAQKKAADDNWIKANTIDIKDGVRVISDAAVAAHELKSRFDDVSMGFVSATSQLKRFDEASMTWVSVGAQMASTFDDVSMGLVSIATGADHAATSLSNMKSAGSGDTIRTSINPDSGGAWSAGGSFGSVSGGGGPGSLPQAGELLSIEFQNANTLTKNTGILINQWTDLQAQLVAAMVAAGQGSVEMIKSQVAGMSPAIVAAMLANLQHVNTAAAAASSQLKSVADAADTVKLSSGNAEQNLSDLTDQLWRLIDAGQSNGQAAYQLRQQIAALGNAAQTTSNAFADTITKTASFSAAIGDLASTAVAATQEAVAATTQARAAGIGGDPFSAAQPLTLPSVPSSTAYATGQQLSMVGGQLVLVQAPPIIIQQVSPEQTGQQVTDILRRAAFQ